MKKEIGIRKYNIRIRGINRDTFLFIKSGKKTVETRAATERYRDIKIGDIMIFVCGKERFEKEVKKVRIFKTIRVMLKTYTIKSIMPNLRFEEELREAYYSYTGYKDKIKKYGLIALEI